MTHVRDYLSNPHWRKLYILGSQPQNPELGRWNYDTGAHTPLFIDANSQYVVQMRRSSSIENPYHVSLTNRNSNPIVQDSFRQCSRETKAPYQCYNSLINQQRGTTPTNVLMGQL